MDNLLYDFPAREQTGGNVVTQLLGKILCLIFICTLWLDKLYDLPEGQYLNDIHAKQGGGQKWHEYQ